MLFFENWLPFTYISWFTVTRSMQLSECEVSSYSCRSVKQNTRTPLKQSDRYAQCRKYMHLRKLWLQSAQVADENSTAKNRWRMGEIRCCKKRFKSYTGVLQDTRQLQIKSTLHVLQSPLLGAEILEWNYLAFPVTLYQWFWHHRHDWIYSLSTLVLTASSSINWCNIHPETYYTKIHFFHYKMNNKLIYC